MSGYLPNKFAWSDKRSNHFVNFYAIMGDRKTPEVLTMPFSLASNEDVRTQLNSERVAKNQPPYNGPILFVCLDMASGRLYLPGMEDIRELNLDDQLRVMFQAIKLKAEKLAGSLPLARPVRGSPLNTIRVRRVGDFYSAAKFITEQAKSTGQNVSDHMNLPVVEANLSQMPKTVARLPGKEEILNTQGRYISPSYGNIVEFYMREEDQETKDVLVLSQKTPFILINISPEMRVSSPDKERLVVSYHREFLVESEKDSPTQRTSPQVNSIKYLMYIGWSFKDLCIWMLKDENTNSLRDLIFNGAYIYNAAKLLVADGYKDPSINPYYYSFEIGSDFPLALRAELTNQPFNYSNQHPIMQVVYFDSKTSVVTIKTPLYLSSSIIKKVFNQKSSTVFTAQYIEHSKQIKSDLAPEALIDMSPLTEKIIKTDVMRSYKLDKSPEIVSDSESMLTITKISDYPQAADILRNLCRKMSTDEKTVKFDDLYVLVGPISESSQGMRGGYCSKQVQEASGNFGPIQIEPRIKLPPPFIIIDTTTAPNVADRNHVIIHEYRHHINFQLWVSDPRDHLEPQKGDTAEDFIKYLSSTQERLAHKTQIKYLFGLGMSKEEILKSFMVEDKFTIKHIPIAREYMLLINEAKKEMIEEEAEDNADVKITNLINEHKLDIDVGDDFFDDNDLETMG